MRNGRSDCFARARKIACTFTWIVLTGCFFANLTEIIPLPPEKSKTKKQSGGGGLIISWQSADYTVTKYLYFR